MTIEAQPNALDSPDKSVTLTGTGANALGPVDVTGATLTLTDNEDVPTVALVLSPSSIAEDGGVSTVTASLSGGASGEAITITVSATAASAEAGDFALSSARTLIIAKGATASTGAVTVSAVNDATDAPNQTVTVSGAISGGYGLVAALAPVTLTLTDDDLLPEAALVLSPVSILENGGVSTVTARLTNPSSEAVTLTVSAAAVAPAVAMDFTRTGTTLTIAAGATTSTGVVTVTAEDNGVRAPDKMVTVSATARRRWRGHGSVGRDVGDQGGRGDADGHAVAVAAVDPGEQRSFVGDRGALAPVKRSGDGDGVGNAVAPAVAGNFTRTGMTLTIAAGSMASTGAVTIMAVGNTADTVNRSVTVSGTVAGGNGELGEPGGRDADHRGRRRRIGGWRFRCRARRFRRPAAWRR